MHWFLDPIKNKYADFSGRATRQEFWMYILVYLGILVVVSIVASVIRMPFLQMLFSLAFLVPNIAITTRRLHDTNKSGWWQLIGLVPIIGLIVMIILLVGKSKNKDNKYGSNLNSDSSKLAEVVSGDSAQNTSPNSETSDTTERQKEK